ncbi:MAG: glycosyltransferase family 9 protein [Deltaproteobacteria bacterium]|nr:glycosyltransferase family 9 protein [Deltaproteobacteria bacterium]
MKVLIVKLSSIGDVIHTLPALTALRRGLGPRSRIDWLVEEGAADVLKRNPFINSLIVVQPRGWTANAKANLKTIKWLRAQKYDAVIDFQGLLKSAVWVRLSGAARRIGFSNGREMSHVFLNEKLPAYDPDLHAVDRYLLLAGHVAGKGHAAAPEFLPYVDERGAAEARRRLVEAGMPEGAGFFVIAPRARWATKLWDDAKFAVLAKRLVSSTGLYAVLAGSADDRAALDAMRAAIGEKAVNAAGVVGLAELSEVFRAASFAVTVDSGPMHAAAAAGTRVIALFGPTAPWRTGPYGKGHAVIRKELPCSPCFKKTCNDPRCMTGITVEEVEEAVDKVRRKDEGGINHSAHAAVEK